MSTPTFALGGVVAAVAGGLVRVERDASLALGSCRLGAAEPVVVLSKILLKGEGAARARFLDDPRNAPKVGSNLLAPLAAALPDVPDVEATLREQHRIWSRAFIRRILAWQRSLAGVTRDQPAVQDTYGRIYLLEWAGFRIDPTHGGPSPYGLEDAPTDAALPTAEAYERYLTSLVSAIAGPAPQR